MRIEGNLATYEFSDLLQWLAQGNKSGVLTVTDGDREYQLGFDHGRIDMSSSSDPSQRLDSYLYGKGVIDEATLARAERLREATKMMSGQVLVTLGAVTEAQLAQALREKTAEILCELLTWERGTFAFEGGERTDASMVPISLEVTSLLLESMHRLDQQQGGPAEPPPAAVFKVPEAPTSQAPAPDATQAIDGLALAEVLDPETPAAAPVKPAEEPEATLPEAALPDADAPPEMPYHYAVMNQSPGPVRRLAPYALVVLLSVSAGFFYLANIEASAEAVDVSPGGEPILFTQTLGPPITAPAQVAEAPAASTAPRPEPVATKDVEAALREQYERQLEGLRRELEEARRLAAAQADGETKPPVPEELPADSMMRAAVKPRRKPAEPPVVLAAVRPAEAPPPAVPVEDVVPRPRPTRQPPATIPGAQDGAAGASTPAPLEAVGPEPEEEAVPERPVAALQFVNPVLLSRPTPSYPEAARRLGRGATVTLRVLIGVDGRVKEVERVGAKAGMGFDRAAETAATGSTWQPGTRDGEPAEMWADLRFEFKL